MTDSAPRRALPPYLEALNEEQRAAVFHSGRNLLILAGAGSGKTRVITTKIAYLIREQGVDPSAILAVTFTNKAAREMAERARLIDGRAAFAVIRTFHSFGAWFLRRHGSLAGLGAGFVIYDDDDARALLSPIMEGASAGEIREAARRIARAKDYFLSPDDPELTLIDHRSEFRRIYRGYEERLARIGNADFGDLIKKPVEILRNNPAMAERFRSRFRVIMVDEYQDANVAQFELLKEIRGQDASVCVVGDDDQSIYRFRGAEVRNILEFPERFPGADLIRLEQNYRSLAPILRVAASVVDHNEGRLGKTLTAVRGTGKKPVLAFLPNQDEEALFCAELIEASRARGEAEYADWAVLYRTNAQSLGFETEFLRRHIPYRVVGSLKFYEREEIKDALALLALLSNPRDEVAFRRVVNKPARGVGPASVKRVAEAALAEALGFCAAAERLASALPAKARQGLAVFFRALEQGRAALSGSGVAGGAALAEEAVAEAPEPVREPAPRTRTHGKEYKKESLYAGEGLSACTVTLLIESGIAEYHLNRDESAGNQRASNLQELANAASLYPPTEAGLRDFLEHIELDRSLQEADGSDPNKVTLITLHNTKGLEFRRVLMTGIEQGVFPRHDKRNEDLEEERRLFYVGATRAMDQLYLSTCAVRRMYGHTMPMAPSVFLHEIERGALRVVGEPPYAFLHNESLYNGSGGCGDEYTEYPD
jgi:DNA helicase-2/ATP-dependent DNA helicase PcrA